MPDLHLCEPLSGSAPTTETAWSSRTPRLRSVPEGEVTDLGGMLEKDRSQRPRRIVRQVLIKPSRLTSPAEVKALALRAQSYQVPLAHTLERFGHLLRHESRLALDDQTASCCTAQIMSLRRPSTHSDYNDCLGSSTRDS
jgi:hypothetical protein